MKLKILIYFGVEKNALRNSVINGGREFKENKTLASNRGNIGGHTLDYTHWFRLNHIRV